MTIELEMRKVTCFTGSYSTYVEKKEQMRIAQERKYENTMAEIKRIEGIIEQQKRWNRERNIRTAEHKQKSIDRLEATLEKPEEDTSKIKFRFTDLLEIAADRLCLHHTYQLFQPCQAITKLVVAQGERIVANQVHQLYDVLSLGNNAQAISLNKVTAGHDADVGIGLLQFGFQSGNLGIPLNHAMYVILIQNDNVLVVTSKNGYGQDADQQHHARNQSHQFCFHNRYVLYISNRI
jgi:hypothetical protein